MVRHKLTGKIIVYRNWRPPSTKIATIVADSEPLAGTSGFESHVVESRSRTALGRSRSATPLRLGALRGIISSGTHPLLSIAVECCSPTEKQWPSSEQTPAGTPARRGSSPETAAARRQSVIVSPSVFKGLQRHRSRIANLEVRNVAVTRILGFFHIIKAKRKLSDLKYNHAALVIQTRWRGVMLRRSVLSQIAAYRQHIATRAVYRAFLHRSLSDVPERFRHHVAAMRIQLLMRRRTARLKAQLLLQELAARTIQRAVKCHTVRRQMAAYKANARNNVRRAMAATQIAAVVRGWRVRRKMRNGGREALRAELQETVALRQRTQRVEMIAHTASSVNVHIDRSRRALEEKQILEMVLMSADPNREVIEWSAQRLAYPRIERKRAQPKLPPIGTIPAQGSKSNQQEDPSFQPLCQALEPGVQTRLLTEPKHLLSSATTRRSVEIGATQKAARILDKKYHGLPDETPAMRYALTTDLRGHGTRHLL